MSRFWQHRHPYLCQIYWTGAVPRRDVESLAVREAIPIPDDLLPTLLSPVTQSITIPNDVLFPKPKRGRPRNDALHGQANDFQCSLRHARRLLATSKPRQRDRERQPDMIEALQARQKRASLVRALHAEEVVSYLSYAISYLRKKNYAVTKKDCQIARELMKHEKTMTAPVLVVSAAMGSNSFHVDAKILGVSRATIYRHCSSRLDEFRRRGQDLLALAVVDVPNLKPQKGKSRAYTSPDTAWEEQTIFHQRYERHDW